MRIIVIGQAAFGAKVLERLMDRNENIVAVYTPPDRPGGRPDPLKDMAISKNVDVFQPQTYKNDGVFAEYKNLNPDLVVMAFVTTIIPAKFFDVPSHGTICYHPSLLPRHRGASGINWAVIMGDSKTGLSIFWPDEGIDTGPILLQKEIAIGPDDTTGSLYFNHLFPMGVDAVLESIDLIKAGNAPKIIQDEAGATYEPPCDDRVAGIDWKKPAHDLYNLVRGCDPQPGAFALLKGEKIRFYGAKRIEEASEKAPGTILNIDDKGIHVAMSGGRLIVGKVRAAKGGKVAAAEFAAERGLKAGVAFDT
ncbi:MAG: methionyl-tRNA formyltransferase [Desulfobacterales bacterium]